jgi:hypothetical protein
MKAIKVSWTTSEISHAKTQNDQKAKIDKLNNDIRRIKKEKAKLSRIVTALITENENGLKKLDNYVAVKLKRQQICAELALEKAKVALRRTI